MNLTRQDYIDIAAYINEKYPNRGTGINWNSKVILDKLDKTDGDIINIKEFGFLISREQLLNLKLQKYIYELAEKRGESLPKTLEDCCLTQSYAGEKFNTYFKYIKDKRYYPQKDDVLLEIIKNVSCETKSMFNNMLTLSTLCKDDKIASMMFAESMDKRNRGSELSLLELEKVKRQWNKRFTNPLSVEGEAVTRLEKYFSKITKGLEAQLINIEDGYFHKTKMDFDAISQETKLTVGKVTDGMRIFLNSIQYFFDDNKDYAELLSICEIEKKDKGENKCEFIVSYMDIGQKDKIKAIFSELIDTASLRGEDRDLKGVDIVNSHEDTDVFFKTFIDKTLLNLELSNKEAINKVKTKNKI